MPPLYGALDGPQGAFKFPRPLALAWGKSAILAGVASTCLVLLVVSTHLTPRGSRSELAEESALVSSLAAQLAKPGESSLLLHHVNVQRGLKQQFVEAQDAVHHAIINGKSKDDVKVLDEKAEEAKKKLAAAQEAASQAEAALVQTVSGDKHADGAPRQQKGFISGDRFGEHHVYDDYGIDHNRRRGNWAERHFGYWMDTANGHHQYVCDNYDDPYETGTHRRVNVPDNEWCDDKYYGYHFPVHYRDDRNVYSNGYGEHLGTVYGDNGVKPGVLHKGVTDHFGAFFHGLTPGYDWREEHGGNHGDFGEGNNDAFDPSSITQYAYSTYKDKTYGDEGDKRQRPLYYMDWDEDGTRALDHTKTFGEEDFMAQAGNFAVNTHTTHPLKSQQLQLQRAQAEAHSLEEEVKKQKLDIEVEKLEQRVAAAKKSMHNTIEQTISKEQLRERRLAARLKTLRHPTHAPSASAAAQLRERRVSAVRRATREHRRLVKLRQTSLASAAGTGTSTGSSDADASVDQAGTEAASILDAEAGDVEASLDAQHVAQPPLSSAEPRVKTQQERQQRERAPAAQGQRKEGARGSKAWLQFQLEHGKGSWEAERRAAEAKRELRQALTLRQEREGEVAQEHSGRPHGCLNQQVTGSTVMLDDCDPLTEKMQPAIEDASAKLAEAAAANKGGVHWTSGDVPYLYDAIPLREAHGGYSGISDIDFPADAVYPTLYKPLVSNPFQGAAYMVQAIGTKSKGGPVLRTAASQAHANKAKAAGMKKAVVAVMKKDEELETDASSVDAALIEEHRLEAVAATDKAIADKVMADAVKNQDELQRTRLLEAATEEYSKAAQATKASQAAARATKASSTPHPPRGSGAVAPAGAGVLPAGAGDVVKKADAHDSADPLAVAQKLVDVEKSVRAQAKALVETDKARTEAIVARNKALNKELSSILTN